MAAGGTDTRQLIRSFAAHSPSGSQLERVELEKLIL